MYIACTVPKSLLWKLRNIPNFERIVNLKRRFGCFFPPMNLNHFELTYLNECVSSSIRFLSNSVLPRQGLWSLTAGLDALDLVAIHDEFILLTDLHVMLEAAVHGVVPFLNHRDLTKNEIQTILTAMDRKSILSQSILHSIETGGKTIRIPCKQAASFDTQNTPHQWTYQPHPPRPTWFPRGSGRKWPSSPISQVSWGWEDYPVKVQPERPCVQCGQIH